MGHAPPAPEKRCRLRTSEQLAIAEEANSGARLPRWHNGEVVMRRMSGGVLLGLAALLVGLVLGLGCATANAQAWPEKYYSVPSMSAVNDTVCSAAGWRDTVYISDYVDAPAGTMHIAVDWKSVWSWTVECPPDDNDVGVWVWVLPAFNSVETDSFLVRQNTAWSQLVPVKAWYIRGANATADSCARYQIVFDGEPPAN